MYLFASLLKPWAGTAQILPWNEPLRSGNTIPLVKLREHEYAALRCSQGDLVAPIGMTLRLRRIPKTWKKARRHVLGNPWRSGCQRHPTWRFEQSVRKKRTTKPSSSMNQPFRSSLARITASTGGTLEIIKMCCEWWGREQLCAVCLGQQRT